MDQRHHIHDVTNLWKRWVVLGDAALDVLPPTMVKAVLCSRSTNKAPLIDWLVDAAWRMAMMGNRITLCLTMGCSWRQKLNKVR